MTVLHSGAMVNVEREHARVICAGGSTSHKHHTKTFCATTYIDESFQVSAEPPDNQMLLDSECVSANTSERRCRGKQCNHVCAQRGTASGLPSPPNALPRHHFRSPFQFHGRTAPNAPTRLKQCRTTSQRNEAAQNEGLQCLRTRSMMHNLQESRGVLARCCSPLDRSSVC